MAGTELAQLSARGTLTLPAAIRRELSLEEGDVFQVGIRDGSVVLTPVAVTPIEIYSDERIAEFGESARMTEKELTRARRAWGLPESAE